MSRLEQQGRVTLSAVLYFCCSLVWIFFVCVSNGCPGDCGRICLSPEEEFKTGRLQNHRGLHLIKHFEERCCDPREYSLYLCIQAKQCILQ